MTEEQSAQAERNARPMMVYVYDVNDEEAMTAMEEDRVFRDERVAVGARFFDCLRINSEAAEEDRLLAPKARRLPALIFVRPNFEIASSMNRRFSASRVFKAMCTTMRKDYANCVQTVLKKQKEIMKDRVALSKDRTDLNRLNEKIADETSANRRKRLIQERDELEGKITQLTAQLDAKENELYKLELKQEKKA
jgi:hypothetical protein